MIRRDSRVLPVEPAKLRQTGETLLIGTLGGAIFAYAGIPAGLISGSVLAVAVAALAGRRLGMPSGPMRIIFVLAGAALGSGITPATLRGIAAYPLSIAILVLSTFCMIGATWIYLRRVHHWDALSALFGASPGGLAQILALSVETGADVRGIVVVQTVRVVVLTVGLPSGLALFGLAATTTRVNSIAVASPGALVVLLLASLLPALALQKLRFPGGLLFGAMLGSGILHGTGAIAGGLPWWVADAVMISLGAINGSRFAGTDRRLLLSYLGAAIGSFAVAIAVTICFMLVAARVLPVPPADLVIGYAPGAQDAMMIVALALQLDPVFVGAHHLARYLTISLCVPFLARAARAQSAARRR